MDNNKSSAILIVDDNSNNLQILADILRGSNYKVAIAMDGLKALDFINKRKPDLILLDIMMPGMDGFEVCEKIKSNEDTKDIPVIFISALKDTIDKVKGFEIGGIDYITKPFQKEEILVRVNSHLKLKHAQEELKQTNESLKAVNATKDKLFSIIAHDLRNPIEGLLLMLNSFEKDPDQLNANLKSIIVNELSSTMKNIHHLLANLLLWARSQQGEIMFQPVHTDLNQIIDECISLLSRIAKEKSIRLVSELRETIPIYADINMIKTVVRNLISNALKFTRESGEIKLTAGLLTDMIKVSIIDTGIGISKDNMEKLFQLDQHFTTIGTKKEKGSGLGLLLCKTFVERNGGKISVESEENIGSIFQFTLPVYTSHL